MPDRFEPFGLIHLAAVVVSAVGWWLATRWAKRVRRTPNERRMRLILGTMFLAGTGVWVVYRLSPLGWDIHRSLPLHGCRIAAVVALWSILSRNRDPNAIQHELAYYWGLGLAPIAIVTPTVVEGPTSVFFWTFWLNHWFSLAVGFVNYQAFFLRPPPGSLPRVAAVTTIVYLAATVVNLLYGTNYSYTGPSLPDQPTPVDWLGSWPWRIFSLWLVVMGAHVVMSLLARGALHLSPHRRARALARFGSPAQPEVVSEAGGREPPRQAAANSGTSVKA